MMKTSLHIRDCTNIIKMGGVGVGVVRKVGVLSFSLLLNGG